MAIFRLKAKKARAESSADEVPALEAPRPRAAKAAEGEPAPLVAKAKVQP